MANVQLYVYQGRGQNGNLLTDVAADGVSASGYVTSWSKSQTGYAEVDGENTISGSGSNNTTIYSSIPAPSGYGWLWQVNNLNNATIDTGTWSIQVQLVLSNGSFGAATLIGNFYRYDASTSTYTFIGTLSGPANVGTTNTTYTVSGSLASQSFGPNDQLYFETWLEVTTGETFHSSVTLTPTWLSSGAISIPPYTSSAQQESGALALSVTLGASSPSFTQTATGALSVGAVLSAASPLLIVAPAALEIGAVLAGTPTLSEVASPAALAISTVLGASAPSLIQTAQAASLEVGAALSASSPSLLVSPATAALEIGVLLEEGVSPTLTLPQTAQLGASVVLASGAPGLVLEETGALAVGVSLDAAAPSLVLSVPPVALEISLALAGTSSLAQTEISETGSLSISVALAATPPSLILAQTASLAVQTVVGAAAPTLVLSQTAALSVGVLLAAGAPSETTSQTGMLEIGVTLGAASPDQALAQTGALSVNVVLNGVVSGGTLGETASLSVGVALSALSPTLIFSPQPAAISVGVFLTATAPMLLVSPLPASLEIAARLGSLSPTLIFEPSQAGLEITSFLQSDAPELTLSVQAALAISVVLGGVPGVQNIPESGALFVNVALGVEKSPSLLWEASPVRLEVEATLQSASPEFYYRASDPVLVIGVALGAATPLLTQSVLPLVPILGPSAPPIYGPVPIFLGAMESSQSTSPTTPDIFLGEIQGSFPSSSTSSVQVYLGSVQ